MTTGNPRGMNVFDPNTHIQAVTIVGLGGTGAQVARSVARMVYDMKVARLHAPQIVLIDPDKVEQKNVGRQLYIEADVGGMGFALAAHAMIVETRTEQHRPVF